MSRLPRASRAPRRRRSSRCRRIRCRPASSASDGASRPTPVDLDTVRYSVPHRLVRDHVDVVVEAERVQVFHGATLVATHRRSHEPFSRVIDPAHYAGLWRTPSATPVAMATPLAALGRQLEDYAAVLTDGGR